MAYDFTSQRLFVDAPLVAGTRIALDRGQANYLLNVLRMGEGAGLLVFNGRDGEWRARIAGAGRKAAALEILEQTRPQPSAPDLDYLFAPLKHARLDYMVQKAVEMGAGRLRPVITKHTHVARVNEERMRANAIEAAEQCGILAIPEIAEPEKLDSVLASWDPQRRLIVCDEGAEVADPVASLKAIRHGPLALLIGPEGGFSEEERGALHKHPAVTILSLGPRILRADTAAVAALAVIQAVIGDWR